MVRHFSIGERDVAIDGSVFNITNNAADQQLQFGANQQSSPFFRRGSTRQFPRAAQLAVQLSF